MKIPLLLALLIALISCSALAQDTLSVKGHIADSSFDVNLTNASVCILNKKDSTLVKFQFTNQQGDFYIKGLPPGSFILLVSYPNYADYVEPFTLNATSGNHRFESINVQQKSRLLHEVVVRGKVNSIKLKGDTTEFNAKAYVNQPNDKVEDLLRQLPGIQVDRDGRITANGQVVNRVLVDGEEFFGDDPTLVTRNLRADMVDKVQLYDKKSDQAAFTGVDDGKKSRTINIKLKEDKKNGVFGKLSAGGGTNNRYETQLMFNRFKAKQKFSVYGTSANNGKTGLGTADNNRLGTNANNVNISDEGGLTVVPNSSDALDSFNGVYTGKGLPSVHSGGVHFDNKWGLKDKYVLNTNYRIGDIDVNGTTISTTQQNLEEGFINTRTEQEFKNHAFRQKFDGSFGLALDNTATLKAGADGLLKNFSVDNVYNSSSANNTGSLINRNNRRIQNEGNQQTVNLSALYTKKFRKDGRTLSWNVSESINNNDTEGYLNSKTEFFATQAGRTDSIQLINQRKTSALQQSVFNSNITYSEPLSNKLALLFNYGLGSNNSANEELSFNQSPSGLYDKIDPLFSNSYKFNQLTNQLGAVFNYKTQKVKLFLGTKASDVRYKQTDRFTFNVFRRNFVNWAPQASLQFSVSPEEGLYAAYNGTNIQPTISQIQPVRLNTDPLNIVVGNSLLKPSFSNTFNISYMVNRVVSGFNFYSYAYLFTRSNAIVTNSSTNLNSGTTTIQYVNLTSGTPLNYSIYMAPGIKVKSLDINVGANLSIDGSTNYNYINGVLGQSKSTSYVLAANIDKSVAKKYTFSVSGGPSYNENHFSLQPQNNNKAFGLSATGSATVYLPKMLIISTDARYSYLAKTNTFDAQYRTLWNATLSKAFFKEQNLTFSITAYNILNQNFNFSRSVIANTIMQSSTNSIGRYLMFSLIWNFNKFKLEKR